MAVAFLTFALGLGCDVGYAYTTAELDVIAEQVARGGLPDVPGEALPCGTQCDTLWLSEHQPAPNPAYVVSKQHYAELTELRTRVGLLPRLSAVASKVSLGAGSFYVGWQIGTGIRTLWIGGTKPQPGGGPVAVASARLKPADWMIISGFYYTIYTPALGYVALDAGDRQIADVVDDHDPGTTPNCQVSKDKSFEAPGWDLLQTGSWTATFNCGTAVSHLEALFAPFHVLRSSLDGPGSVEEYDGTQPLTEPAIPAPWPHPDTPARPTTATENRGRVVTELEGNPGAYPVLRAWYDHEFHPDDFPDPRTLVETEQDHRCDLSTPPYKNPGGSDTPPRLTPKDPVPFTTTGRPSGSSGAPDPYLRWGQTKWGGTYIDNWPGWGWRHIQAKHGWTTADETATRTTLASPVYTSEPEATSMLYVGAETVRGGAICERVVLVQYEPKPGDTDPYGIITSYERYVAEAP